jgi:dienelactone hydrolase
MKPPILTRRRFVASSLAALAAPGLLRAAETGSRKDVAWLAEVQTPPEVLPPDAPKLSQLLVDADGRKITTLAAWQKRRGQIRRWWLDFLGQVKVDSQGPPPLKVLSEDRPDGAVRQRVRYEVEPGLPAEAYLLKPEKQQGPAPGVVVLHSTDNNTIRQGAGLAGPPEKAFGLRLARRGCVTICPRCFLWPNDLEPPEEKKLSYAQRVKRFRARHPGCRGMAKMLYDAVVALDILAGLPGVDAGRLGVVGHSLGAKEVLYLAAFDERVKVAVSSEGGIGTRFSNWDAPWYLDKDIRRPGFHHEQHELLALVAPRAFLLLGGNSADGDRSWPFIEAALPVYRLYGGTPRLGLFNHKKGHAVPPEAQQRIDEWFAAYL